jgi:alginate O-acetyltransferase complex protein AlgI
LSWVLFYFTNFGRMIEYLAAMFGQNGTGAVSDLGERILQENAYWLFLCLVVVLPVRPYITGWVRKKLIDQNRVVTWQMVRLIIGITYLLISSVLLVGDAYNPFIYFRF